MLSDRLFCMPILDVSDIESIIECYRETIDSYINEEGKEQFSLSDLVVCFIKQAAIHIECEQYNIVENSVKNQTLARLLTL